MALISFLLRQEATIKPWIREANGRDIYGPEEKRKCRIRLRRNLETTYKDLDGQIDQTLAKAVMYCAGEPIPERSVVTYEGQEHIVIRCYRAYGFSEDHLEVLLQ